MKNILKHSDFIKNKQINEAKNDILTEKKIEIAIDLHQYTFLSISSFLLDKKFKGNHVGTTLNETLKLKNGGAVEVFHDEDGEYGYIVLPIMAGLKLEGTCNSNGLLLVDVNDKKGYVCSEIYIAEMFEVSTELEDDEDEDSLEELYDARFKIYTFEHKQDAEAFVKKNESKSLEGQITKIKA